MIFDISELNFAIPLKKFLLLFLVVFSLSCIPERIAPSIDNYKLVQGKKFKKSLSKRHIFIFEDPKSADHFYHYVDTKFQLNNQNVFDDVPFEVGGEPYFFAFYEVEIPTKILNLGPTYLIRR